MAWWQMERGEGGGHYTRQQSIDRRKKTIKKKKLSLGIVLNPLS
jgi:hypothetical protein